MEIIKITSSFFNTNSYLLINSNHDAILIDTPSESSQQIFELIKQKDLSIKKIVLTHGHWDHIADAEKIKRFTQAEIFIHNLDAHYLEEKKSHDFMMIPIELDTVKPDFLLLGNELISINEIELKVIHTPGHTAGGICLYSKQNKSLFSGDTLFQASIGRTDFPDGNHFDLLNAITTKLFTLPDSTIIYPGHGPESTIVYEKLHNPFLG